MSGVGSAEVVAVANDDGGGDQDEMIRRESHRSLEQVLAPFWP